ncbi:MAG: heme-binding protein [Chloroflexota bacterium]|nr:heme-binding protein [Chloroflexia bacterium]MDQ3226789.1 heme-binding protein [Chloroflexota bacterium]
MSQGNPTTHSRRDSLRIASAAGIAVAAGSAWRRSAAAQTPAATGEVSLTKQSVTLAAAQRMIEAAQAKATELGVAVVIAVVDEGGMLKALHRMDGVISAVPLDIGPMKAYTAASFRTPTHQLAENNLENPARMASLPNVPRVTLLAGGYPIVDGDVVVGGIGISGAAPDQDMEIGEAAIAALRP